MVRTGAGVVVVAVLGLVILRVPVETEPADAIAERRALDAQQVRGA
jgi:hypothetical protein